KSPSSTSVTQGQNFNYTFTATNIGAGQSTGVTITDTLPSGLSFVSANPNVCSGLAPISCNLGTLNGGGAAQLVMTVAANTTGSKTNTASVSGSNESN